MSIIKCSECGKEISDHAQACPSCGNPISSQHANVNEAHKPVEIELTSKKWKKRIILAIVFLIVGWIVMLKSIGFGILLMFIAFIIGITARVGAWWTNG